MTDLDVFDGSKWDIKLVMRRRLSRIEAETAVAASVATLRQARKTSDNAWAQLKKIIELAETE